MIQSEKNADFNLLECNKYANLLTEVPGGKNSLGPLEFSNT